MAAESIAFAPLPLSWTTYRLRGWDDDGRTERYSSACPVEGPGVTVCMCVCLSNVPNGEIELDPYEM